MSRRSRFLTTGLAALGLFASFMAPAQAADDDFEFAQALYQRGYTDLAEEKFLELLNDPKRSAKEKGEGTDGMQLNILADPSRVTSSAWPAGTSPTSSNPSAFSAPLSEHTMISSAKLGSPPSARGRLP